MEGGGGGERAGPAESFGSLRDGLRPSARSNVICIAEENRGGWERASVGRRVDKCKDLIYLFRPVGDGGWKCSHPPGSRSCRRWFTCHGVVILISKATCNSRQMIRALFFSFRGWGNTLGIKCHFRVVLSWRGKPFPGRVLSFHPIFRFHSNREIHCSPLMNINGTGISDYPKDSGGRRRIRRPSARSRNPVHLPRSAIDP